MNLLSWLLWGFLATLMLTVVLMASQGTGVTRISIPYLLGTLFTPDRDRARLVGFLVHLVNGWLFSLLYVAGFHALGLATWWLGALGGLAHATVVLVVGMPLLPGLHPRMTSEHRAPTVVRQLEPPGFLALHYGRTTPLVIVVAHVAFGAVLGGFYEP